MTAPPERTLQTFYRDEYAEAGRLTRSPSGRLERTRTEELLRRHLPAPPARVLDVGGGTGVHARWLAADGYAVHLVDPVPSHVAAAREDPAPYTAAEGDARALEAGDASVDAVLLLGPLYHLTDRADRQRALAEAVRVVRPGGLVAAAVISRYAALLDLAARGLLDEEAAVRAREESRTGRHDPRLGFTTAYVHTHDEAAGELVTAGLVDVAVYGVEGPSAPAADAAAGTPEAAAVEAGALHAARAVEREPALLAASPHLLAVARRRTA